MAEALLLSDWPQTLEGLISELWYLISGKRRRLRIPSAERRPAGAARARGRIGRLGWG